MSLVAQVITVPKQPQLSAAELELARKKSQEALDRSKGVDGWLGSVTLASGGVPKLALTFWRDAAACQANVDANPDAIAHARKHGLLDQVDVRDLISGEFKGSPRTGEATLAEVITITENAHLSDEQLEQARQVAQAAMDENANVDGCVGAILLGHLGGSALAVNFWRDEAALKAYSATSQSLIAAARQANPTTQIGDPEIMEVFSGAHP